MSNDLNGKVALVTGGARDVGRQIALSLAAEGASIALNYNSSPHEAEQVVAEIQAMGGTARAYQADVSNYEQVKHMVDRAVADLGRLDILVNNAGLIIREHFVNSTPEGWAKQVGVGLYGVIHTAHAAAPYMIKQNGGRIITLAGDSARIGESGLAVTAAARAGAIALIKSLARELGRNNITANAVSLGLIQTAHSDPAWLEQHHEKIIRMYPLRRIGTPNDVAPAVAFLASNGANWITGQVLSVNGGFSMS